MSVSVQVWIVLIHVWKQGGWKLWSQWCLCTGWVKFKLFVIKVQFNVLI